MDFDMHNLFYPRPLLEEMADAATGAHEILPQKTLRDRQHGNSPLIVRPKYQGDFLDKLRQPLQGKPLEVEAADEENLWDFSMPSEWLKHQEAPHPRVMLDDFYEMNHPDKDNGGKDLKEYWDRSWDQTDAPEISEDKWLRSWYQNAPVEGPYKTARRVVMSFLQDGESCGCLADPGVVLSSYLMEQLPLVGAINFKRVRTAKLLADLVSAQITTQKGGERSVNTSGVTITPTGSKPYLARWTFKATSGKGGPGNPYTVTLQFIPHGATRDCTKLHVRVSCTCPSFLFWGAQYHAVMMDYLYGGIRPKFSPPRVRDPNGGFLVCKHIKKVIEDIYDGKIGNMTLSDKLTEQHRRTILRKPKFEVQKEAPAEKLKIPKDLIIVGKRPHIQQIVKEWPDKKTISRRKIIESLKDPEEVMYLVHRFPHEASAFAAAQFKKMIIDPKTNSRVEALAKDYYKEIEGIKADLHEIKLPDNLKRDFGDNKDMLEVLDEWDKKGPTAKRQYIMEQTDPDRLAYLAFNKHEDPKTVSLVLERLNDMHTSQDFNPSEQHKADMWKRTII
jgi:hypothetical protein